MVNGYNSATQIYANMYADKDSNRIYSSELRL